MAQTADVMKAELNKLRSDLYAAFQTAEHREQGNYRVNGAQSADAGAVKELVVEIERLVQHMENIDKQMAEVCLLHEHPYVSEKECICRLVRQTSLQTHTFRINMITVSRAV
jgi:hypothetical protein